MCLVPERGHGSDGEYSRGRQPCRETWAEIRRPFGPLAHAPPSSQEASIKHVP